MRRAIGVLAFLVSTLLLSALPIGAQPLGWMFQTHYSPFSGTTRELVVFNFATSVAEASFPIPDDLSIGRGPGVLTPDGRYYLRATSAGIARFQTSPPAFDRMLAAGVPVLELTVEPTGVRLHAIGAFGHAVLDWETGVLLDLECCAQPSIYFSPDGSTSVHIGSFGPETAPETRVSAFSEPGHALRWTTVVAGRRYDAAVGSTDIALQAGDQLVIWSLVDGRERTRLPRFASGLAWREATLLISEGRPAHRLSADDPSTSTERLLLQQPLTRDGAGGVWVSADGRYAYWLGFSGLLHLSGTSYSVVDIDAAVVVRSGGWPGNQGDLTLEAAPQCLHSAPALLQAPAEGGNVGVTVVPGPGCRPWTAPSALNPGPHQGVATVLISVGPNPAAVARELGASVGGQTVRIQQPSAVPGAPELAISLTGSRVTLMWSPTVGGGVTSWVVRGARAGTPLSDVATVDVGLRAWTSPPLSSGSYEVELIAVNSAGRSPASNLARFSLGVTEAPEAPVNVTAAVIEDHVSLHWAPSPSGPAPFSYIVEAAAAGGGDFIPVMTSQTPSVVVPRAPLGAWRVRVRAQTAGGASVASAPVDITTSACAAPPGPPPLLWSVMTLGAVEAATVRWSAPATSAAHEYVIELGSALGTIDIGRFRVAGDVYHYTAPIPPYGTRVFVQVRARSACGESVPSNPVVVPAY